MSIGVVVLTRNRRVSLLRTLDRLRALPERPPVLVVDNASTDATPGAVRAAHPDVSVLHLDTNLGAAGRNHGVRRMPVRYVAFCDDDSFWRPGALDRAAAVLDANPRLGLLAGRVLVGPQGRLDPTCRLMADSPLGPAAAPPGQRVLGFLACAAVVRREAFLAAGGFQERLGIGGEEQLLAIDLRSRGWEVVYDERVVGEHHPPGGGGSRQRVRRQLRNALWVTWLRRRFPGLVGESLRLLRSVPSQEAAAALLVALAGAPWIARERSAVDPDLERELAALTN